MSGTGIPPVRPAPDLTRPAGSLAGLRVIEVGDPHGEFAGKLLADAGAWVTKVEPPVGAPSRRLPPFLDDRPDSAGSLFFRYYNSGKECVTLDLTAAAGRRTFDDLLAAADVLLDSLPVGSWDRLSLPLAKLGGRYPHLVITSISLCGQTGPHARYVGGDSIACALGGMTYLNGHPDGPPLRPFGPQAWHCAGYATAIGTLAAIAARGRRGHGQRLDISIQEAVAFALENAVPRYLTEGVITTRRGARHWSGASWVTPARDGLVLLSTHGDWEALVHWLDFEGYAGDLLDPKYRDPAERRAAADRIAGVLSEWAATHDRDELVESAQARRIPFAPVLTLPEVLAHPHLKARGWGVGNREWGVGSGGRRTTIDGIQFPVITPHCPLPIPHCPLSGLRIADFTWVVAGPQATRILGDLGAAVIKIERVPEPGTSAAAIRGQFDLWGTLNRSKASVGLDLTRPPGIELARRIIEQCDVVIENFSPRVMGNFGLDYGTLAAARPDLVMLSLSGTGQTGPLRDWVTFGPAVQALAGQTALIAEPGGPVAGYGFPYADLLAGYAGALAVLAALEERRQTGRGRFVDLSQWEVAAAAIGPAWLDLTLNGRAPSPLGNLSPDGPAAPDGVYPCAGADRWCVITCRTDEEWQALVAVLGRPAWALDPLFAGLSGRISARPAIDERLAEWTSRLPAHQVMTRLQVAGVPAGVVQDARDLVDRDPQLRHRNHWQSFATSAGSAGVLEALPIHLAATPARISRLAPSPGEDTDQILRELLGLAEDDIDRLRSAGIIA